MTEARLYVRQMHLFADYVTDRPLCRWVLARHARARGNTFIHFELES